MARTQVTSLDILNDGVHAVDISLLGADALTAITNNTKFFVHDGDEDGITKSKVLSMSVLDTYNDGLYIQNQKDAQQSADLWLSGYAIVDTQIQTPSIQFPGTSTGYTTLISANASATNYTATLPAKTGTIAMTSDLITNPITGTGTSGYIPKFTGTGSLGNSPIYTDGTNVGIGTTAPGLKLDVAGTARVGNGTNFATNDGGLLLFSNNAYKIGFDGLGGSVGFIRYNVDSADSIHGHIFSAGPIASPSNIMLIRGDGKVGIGTTNPGQKLEINGGVNLGNTYGATLFLSDAGGTYRYGLTRSTGTANGLNLGDGFNLGANVGVGYGIASVLPQMFNVAGSAYIQGNVGIGTTGPGELLSLGTAGTKAGVLSLAGATSGKAILQANATNATNPTLTLPTGSGTLARIEDLPSISGLISLTSLSSTATGLTYTPITGVFSLTSGYEIPTSSGITAWNAAYGWGNHASMGYLTSLPSHAHGNITNGGYIDATAGLPLITGTDGIVQTGAFGTSAGTFASGNHTHSYVSGTPWTSMGYLINTNNLSDVSSASTARTNLGLAIGTNVQAYNSYLTGINQALTTTSSPSFTTVTAALTGHASLDLPLTGGTLSDNLILVNNKFLYSKNTSGTVKGLIGISDTNKVLIDSEGLGSVFGGAISTPSSVTADSFIKPGYNSSYFLKADGSVSNVAGASYMGEINGGSPVDPNTTDDLYDLYSNTGWYYACSVAGTAYYGGSGTTNSIHLEVGDQVYSNGTVWLKIPGAGSYTLPSATAIVKGGVIIGSGITLSGSTISVSTAYRSDTWNPDLSAYSTKTVADTLYKDIDYAPDLSGLVPYSGATEDVNLGASFAITAANFVLTSDERLKTNIVSIPLNDLDIQYKAFEMKSKLGDKRYGVLAQELLKVAPELVLGNDTDGYSVKYIDLLVREVATLKHKIKQLENHGSTGY